MPLPESNLPPDAQKWRRAIEKDLAELKKAVGIAATNLTSTRARFTGVASQAAAAEQVVQEVVQEVGAVADEANRNDRSSWEPKPPENPRHNQRWFDTTDGNLMRVWINHGEYERINYTLNPNFSTGTDNWTLVGGDLEWREGFDPHADLVATTDGATFVLEEVQGRAVSLELEETEDDEDGEGGSEQSFVGVPWSASAHLTAYSDNLDVTAVLEVVDTNDNVLASSGPVVLPVEQVTVVQAPSVLEEYDIVGAKIRLTVTGVDEGDYVSLDKIMLEAIAEPEEDYFDGDMPGVTWETLSQGTVSVWSGEPDWYVLQDENAIQTAIDGAKDTLANAFTTSVNAPTPADGADRPDGAYWTQINVAGEQVARWRWVADPGEWVSTPLSVEFIPEAYVDFLAANVAFVEQLLANNIEVSGHLGVTGTFSAESDEYELALAPSGIQLIVKQSIDETPINSWVVPGVTNLATDLTSSGNRLWTISSQDSQDPNAPNWLREWTLGGTLVAEEISGASDAPRYSRIRAAGNYLLGVMRSPTGAYSARLMDLDRNVLTEFPFASTAFGADTATVTPTGNVITMGFGGPFVPNKMLVYSSTGTLLHEWHLRVVDYSANTPVAATAARIYVSNPESSTIDAYLMDGTHLQTISAGARVISMRVVDDVLFAYTTDGRVQGYDANSAAPRFSWGLPFHDTLFPLTFTVSDGSLIVRDRSQTGVFRVSRYGIGDLPVALAEFSTITGRLRAVGATFLGNTQVDQIQTQQITGLGGQRPVLGDPISPTGLNRFTNLQEADQEMPTVQAGTRITTSSPLAEWVRVANPSGPEGQWVRVWSEDQADTGWIDLTLINGWTAQNPAVHGVPGVRRIGKQVFFRGRVSGGSATAIAIVPQYAPNGAALRPDAIWPGIVRDGAAAGTTVVFVNTPGQITATSTSSTPNLHTLNYLVG